jgi:3-phenylpropionate/trans-cinnamate dioxygenase ferredoxin reductase subunit
MSAGMVIVGAGECGTRAAFALRESGYAGPVTLIGSEPHLPYERPPLSKTVMMDRALGAKLIADEARLAAAGIDHVRGETVDAVTPEAHALRLKNGHTVPYDKLLLATGARPRRLSGDAPVAYLRTLDDAVAIRARLEPGKHLVVIGAGFIGLELAASARALGATVTILEAQPRILTRGVPEELAALLHQRHVSGGVELRTGVGVASIEGDAQAVTITLKDGETIRADLVVAGIGAAPNTDLAVATELLVDNGVLVDEQLRTSAPDIYAAGDCCNASNAVYGHRVRLESWRSAQEQGALAARNMLGAGESWSAVPWFWSDQYDLTLQVAGLADGAAQTARRELGDGAVILFHLAADGRLLAASGLGVGNAIAKDVRLAEMLIARRAVVDPAMLASPAVKLKSLLAA